MARVRGYLLAILFVLVLAALGVLLLAQTLEALRLLVPVVFSSSRMDTITWNRLTTALPRLIVAVLAVVWMGMVLVWQYRFWRDAQRPARNWRRFWRAALVELAVAGLASLVVRL